MANDSANANSSSEPKSAPKRTLSLRNLKNDFVPRVVRPNKPDANEGFSDNSIRTSKYTFLSFFPRSLFEQFRRVANFYFLVIAVLQSIKEISPLEPFTAIFPLVAVLSATLVKEGYEDYLRHKMDSEINNKEVRVLQSSGTEWKTIRWLDLKVGDIVLLKNTEQIPADLLMLSGGVEGLAYVETSNLDGETNLKIKQALEETVQPLLSSEDLLGWRGCVECEHPNNNLFKFDGSLRMSEVGGDSGVGSPKIPLNIDQILLRGCTIRNTAWCTGLVLYTGQETKLMMNQTEAPSKRSHVERSVNLFLYQIFFLQFIICTICAIFSALWVETWGSKVIYIQFGNQDTTIWGILSFLTFVVLFNVMIPISLYVSLEMVKVAQALFIGSDIEMYDPVSDTPARARTSNLPEELGQVEYVFSDKTGTLTENKMDFVACSVGGVVYGGSDAPPCVMPELPGDPMDEDCDVPFADGRLSEAAKQSDAQGENAKMFLRLLATCHTVVIERDSRGGRMYQSASPDEGALVKAARVLGFWFNERGLDTLQVEENGITKKYNILNVLEFNSTRKRMSVIMREQDTKKIILFCKGADSVIFERLTKNDPYREETIRDLEIFASQGLRTLCCAYSLIDEKTYEEWSRQYHEASVSILDRDAKLDAAAEQIEQNLSLIGATAIEDKLQDGVPSAIDTMINAGIKVWVLTGDKIETAINIGFACKLLHGDQELIIVDGESAEEVGQQLKDAMKKIDPAKVQFGASLIASGKALEFVIDSTVQADIMEEADLPEEKVLPKLFLDLSKRCKTVMCCRVSPLQKALVVRLVRGQLKAVTLAIGDGANDVGMIQKADLGVGISGQEGMQAVLSSDYALAQFRFLERLLLVHGRYSYRRISVLMLYSFYKNFSFSLTNLWFAIFSGFGGSTLHSSEAIGIFNVVFTGLPVLILAIFDKDVSPEMMKELPMLYSDGPQFKLFNYRKFAMWILNGLYQSVVFFFVPYFVMDAGKLMIPGNGHGIDIWAFGLTVGTGAIVGVNLKLAMEIKTWTWLNWVSTILSVACWFIFMVVMSLWNIAGSAQQYFYHLYFPLATSPLYWFSVFASPIIALLPDFVSGYIRAMYWPTPSDIARELESMSGVLKAPGTGMKSLGGTSVELGTMVGSVPSSTPVTAAVFARAATHTGFAFSGESGEADALLRTMTSASMTMENSHSHSGAAPPDSGTMPPRQRDKNLVGIGGSVGTAAGSMIGSGVGSGVKSIARTATSSSLLTRGRSSGRISVEGATATATPK